LATNGLAAGEGVAA